MTVAGIEFGGKIGNDWTDSEPWWPPLPTPPAGAPNVVLVVLDDVGFAQLGCYGSDIATPVIDGIAAQGVRLTNFHTTALCSPTRACLLTGRNHHRSGMGRVADLATGFPGYWGRPPRDNGFISEILRANGYATYAVGKWHLTPEDETNMARSRTTWPLGRGFDRWYGFHGGETHQFVPGLYHDNHIVRPPRTTEEGYHLSQDLADRAIEYLGDLRAVDDELPFFLYFATGACHSPHHAPAEWIERYRGHFAQGWDRWRDETFARQLATGVVPEGTTLSPRPPWVPAWDTLDERERALSERFMECFAAFLSYTDEQIGRVLDFVDDLGDGDNTVVILVSDNGASSEGGKEGTINEGRLSNFEGVGVDEMYRRIHEIGGPLSHNNYPWGWTMAGNTPFKRWKREVHEGGVADPCIVRSPRFVAAAAGGLRRQYAHAVDILPTVLELVGVAAPAEIDGVEQSRIDGTSFAYVLDQAGERAPGRHITQHFEMLGSRAIYHDGWKAVTFHPVGPLYDDGLRSNAPFDDDVWELYHVAEDVSEVHDRAAEFPEKVEELVALWWEEARRNDVLPLDNRVLDAMAHKHDRRRYQDAYRYFQGGAQVPEWVAVDVRNRSHAMTVDIETPEGVAPDGVLLALGCALGGWSFHVRDGRLRYVHNLHGQAHYEVVAAGVLAPGRHTVEFRFDKDQGAGGTAALFVDGEAVGEAEVPKFTPVAFNEVGVGLTCGYEWGPAVGSGYQAPFTFNGAIVRAQVTATGPVVHDPVADVAAILASQ
ncbi:MAG TPA: arylsulfatase [Acidimicrobiales bacterium]|nr:arylsulfatase [Acidimicrobiales bacterium]